MLQKMAGNPECIEYIIVSISIGKINSTFNFLEMSSEISLSDGRERFDGHALGRPFASNPFDFHRRIPTEYAFLSENPKASTHRRFCVARRLLLFVFTEEREL